MSNLNNLTPTAPGDSPAALPPPLLLVVDDREENLIAMQALLGEDENWDLRCADSGEQALRCLLQEDVSLVLLDVQMPVMDGYEVAKLMRGNPRTRHTPIIFISAIAQTQDSVLRGYNSGAVDFILKPFNPTVLRQKIYNLLDYENNRRELQRLSQQLERERAFNASVLSNAAEGIMVVGEDGRIQYANSAMAQMVHGTVDALQGKQFLHLLAAPAGEGEWQQSPFYRHWRDGQTYRLREAALCTGDEATLPVTLSCSPLPRLQQAMVVIVRDMAIEHDLRTRLEAMIVTDPLTGLFNRRGFYQAVESAMARTKRSGTHLALIYIDLDGFKQVNDSLGHDAGDELLCHVAEQLRAGTRSYDSLARLGGDEFAVLLDNLESCRDAARVADKLMGLIARRRKIANENVNIGVSAGIACYPECGESVEDLLHAADLAMYESKRNGRQQYHFHSPNMTARAHARLELEHRLRQAIEEQQFTLAYQPQFYLESGRLRGFEALLRWPQGSQRAFPPEEFITRLEETRLINPLGQWIFHEGVTRLSELRQYFGDHVILSVNVSPVQFALPKLVDNLADLLRAHDLPPTQLEIEVTESVLMQNLEITQAHLRQLRELGIKVAIDDFGTGYSSLAYLRQFDIDTLKIDRLFIANMLESPRDAAVVSTIIDLSHHLGLEVVAEGVETGEQRQWLLRQHCAIMQGYLACPALPFDAATQVTSQLDWNQVPLKRP